MKVGKPVLTAILPALKSVLMHLQKVLSGTCAGGDTKPYAFFYMPIHYIESAGMWKIMENFSDTRYMAGFKEWTLDGLKEKGATV